MLLFGLILLVSATSFLGLLSQTGRFKEQGQADRLAHNLMETLLALPPEKARALHPEERPEWTAHQRYQVNVQWAPYQQPRFEKLSVEYLYKGQSLIRLITLVPRTPE